MKLSHKTQRKMILQLDPNERGVQFVDFCRQILQEIEERTTTLEDAEIIISSFVSDADLSVRYADLIDWAINYDYHPDELEFDEKFIAQLRKVVEGKFGKPVPA